MSSLSAASAYRGNGTRRVGAAAPAIRRRSSQVVKVAADMGPEMTGAIDKFIGENKVVCFIKGTKEQPRCGFSNTVVQIFSSMGVPFETVDILADENLRQGMKIYSSWPTFPQVYVDGEFYGGCDICIGACAPILFSDSIATLTLPTPRSTSVAPTSGGRVNSVFRLSHFFPL